MSRPKTLYHELLASEYRNQVDPIIERQSANIEAPDFLGFTDTYKALAKLIPRGRTVYDLGCFCAFQGWYFRNHRAYVGVDASIEGADFFRVKNGRYYHATIIDFLVDLQRLSEIHIAPSFAIVNYVPMDEQTEKLIKATFDDLFVFYPVKGDHPDEAWSMNPTGGPQ